MGFAVYVFVVYVFVMPAIVILCFSYVCYQTFKSKLFVTIYAVIALVFLVASFFYGLGGVLFAPLCFFVYFPLRLVYIIGVRADGRNVAFGGGRREIIFLIVMTILSCVVIYFEFLALEFLVAWG